MNFTERAQFAPLRLHSASGVGDGGQVSRICASGNSLASKFKDSDTGVSWESIWRCSRDVHCFEVWYLRMNRKVRRRKKERKERGSISMKRAVTRMKGVTDKTVREKSARDVKKAKWRRGRNTETNVASTWRRKEKGERQKERRVEGWQSRSMQPLLPVFTGLLLLCKCNTGYERPTCFWRRVCDTRDLSVWFFCLIFLATFSSSSHFFFSLASILPISRYFVIPRGDSIRFKKE